MSAPEGYRLIGEPRRPNIFDTCGGVSLDFRGGIGRVEINNGMISAEAGPANVFTADGMGGVQISNGPGYPLVQEFAKVETWDVA